MVIQIDLKRNPDVASLLADMEMGSKVKFLTSLKSKTSELAEFTLDKAAECSEADCKEHYDEGEEDDGESEEEAETDGDQMKKHSKMPFPDGSKNTPGGSQEQDKLAASLTAQI